MKIIKYSYKFRLNPSEEQKILLNKHFGSVRWIYNYFLNQRKEEYINNKKSLNYYEQAGELTQIKKQEDKLLESASELTLLRDTTMNVFGFDEKENQRIQIKFYNGKCL